MKITPLIQRKGKDAEVNSDIESGINGIRGGGQPLPESVRSFFEPRFGHDFSGVRVHNDSRATESARAINAKAFTLGNDIVFGAGQYKSETGEGRRLLAHELTHVVQQKESFPAIFKKRSPDVAHNGYYSFYSKSMLPGQGTEVRVQFYQDPSGTGNATFAVWYQESGTMKNVSFAPNTAIQPKILDEDIGIITFDLNDDEVPEIILIAMPNNQTLGVDFSATLNSAPFFNMATAPVRKSNYVPGKGIYFGQLPDGRPYYLVPTGPLPNGPIFVDDNGQMVNPALEAQGAAVSDMFRTFFVGWSILSASAAGILLIGSTATGAVILRFLFTGPRAIAGATSAAANLATQAMEYGAEFDKYNWPSVGVDYVIGAISNEMAQALFKRWPAPIFTQAKALGTWVNLGRQQIIFLLYGTLVGLIRAQVANTRGGSTVASQQFEGVAQAAKSGAMQSFLFSSFGKAQFRGGLQDPRIIFINKFLDFIIKVAIREVFDVTPAKENEGKK